MVVPYRRRQYLETQNPRSRGEQGGLYLDLTLAQRRAGEPLLVEHISNVLLDIRHQGFLRLRDSIVRKAGKILHQRILRNLDYTTSIVYLDRDSIIYVITIRQVASISDLLT